MLLFLKKLVDSNAISCQSVEVYLGLNGRNFQRQYKNTLSDYHHWNQKDHAEDYLIYPKNIGYSLSIDETAMSNGELYTILINKAKKGKKGSIVGISKGTQAADIIKIIKEGFNESQRRMVKEVTLDMANSMNLIVEKCFPGAMRVVGRFHVQILACVAVQELRVKYRWDAIEQANNEQKQAKLTLLSLTNRITSNSSLCVILT
jgi:hypothetical protein